MPTDGRPRKSPWDVLPAPADPTDRDENEVLLHTLLMVHHGKDLTCEPLQPNVYLNCKFFGSEESTRSEVSWGQTEPKFNLVQVI